MTCDVEREYPLPPGWTPEARLSETLQLGETSIALCGLSAVGPRGECATGSAAAADGIDSCGRRGYFELLERVSLATAMASDACDYQVCDRLGRAVGTMPRAEVFPESADPARWRLARSNGVALHMDWDQACERALAEVVERDRVLRSWYGECAVHPAPLLAGAVPAGAADVASWRAYRVLAGAMCVETSLCVAVVVGMPRDETVPLAYGFAARADADEAVCAAAVEAVQRLGFLYGEEIPVRLPEFSPTPDFHQEFFLYPPARDLLRSWLEGESNPSASSRAGAGRATPRRAGPTRFVDLTPRHLRGRIAVVKALCAGAEPLVFGEPAPHRSAAAPSRRVHPIA